MPTKQTKKAYARAGVDVDLGNRLKRGLQRLVRQTYGPQVLGKIGGFGGLFRADFRRLHNPVLIASIDSGIYLDRGSSGMEDPKSWGIQVTMRDAREIRGGKLTDRYFKEVGVTGYVPEVLGSITAVANDLSFDAGMCGKGHKELVPVSSGGPHLRLRARLS